MFFIFLPRDAKLEGLQTELGSAVAACVTGEDWRRAPTFASQFRSRSRSCTVGSWTWPHACGYPADPRKHSSFGTRTNEV